jgi:hypothetical protein
MDRVVEILRALFRRALREHGREAPALTDIIVERASGGFEPRLGVRFSNGYHATASMRPADCYAFCDRHAAWDMASLRRALLREGLETYERLREEHVAELNYAEQRAELDAQLRHLDYDLAGPLVAPRRNPFLSNLARSLFGDIGSKRAQERGLRLLKDNLSAAQRIQYEAHRYFDVVGGSTGRRYRIRHGRQMNIDQLDRTGRRICGWCFYPQGGLVAGDVMLAQKTALEAFESEALRIANRY